MLRCYYLALAVMLMLSAGLSCLCGCRQTAPAPPAATAVQQLADLLPQLADLEQQRTVADTHESLLLGSEYFLHSEEVSTAADGKALELQPETLPLAWAIYRIWVASTREPRLVQLELDIDGEAAYVALSDYARGRWEIHGPVGSGYTEYPLTLNFRSPNYNTYVAVICLSGTDGAVFNVRGRLSSFIEWDNHIVEYLDGARGDLALGFVAGLPIIVYSDAAYGALHAARATRGLPTSGEHWIKSTVAATYPTSPEYVGVNIIEVAGKAAVSYVSAEQRWVGFARAQVAQPASDADWVAMRVYESADVIRSRTSLCAVGGVPWIAFDYWPGFGDTRGCLANAGCSEPVETDWQVFETASGAFAARYCSIVELDERLCLFGFGESPGGVALTYGRAAVAAPSSINDFILRRVSDYGWEGDNEILGVVHTTADAFPAAAFLQGGAYNYGVLYYLTTQSPDPEEAADWVWNPLDSAISSPALSEVNGRPLLAFYRNAENDLAIARATTAFPGEAGDWIIEPASSLIESSAVKAALVVSGDLIALAYADPVSHYLYFCYRTDEL